MTTNCIWRQCIKYPNSYEFANFRKSTHHNALASLITILPICVPALTSHSSYANRHHAKIRNYGNDTDSETTEKSGIIHACPKRAFVSCKCTNFHIENSTDEKITHFGNGQWTLVRHRRTGSKFLTKLIDRQMVIIQTCFLFRFFSLCVWTIAVSILWFRIRRSSKVVLIILFYFFNIFEWKMKALLWLVRVSSLTFFAPVSRKVGQKRFRDLHMLHIGFRF